MKTLKKRIGQLGSRLLGPVRWTTLQHNLGRLSKGSYYDRLTELVIQNHAQEDSVFVDVGCHEGDILKVMMRKAPGATFLAFEPIPALYTQLVRDFASDRVKVFNLALSDSKGSTTFNYVVSNPAYSGIRKRSYDRANEQDEEIEVMTDTLDNVVQREGLGSVTFIKIDVEGAEYLVLKGAEETIRRCKPVIVFEHGLGGSDYYGKGPEELYDLVVDRFGLAISLLPSYLLARKPLGRAAFSEQFHQQLNFYFVAHPLP